MSTGYQIITVGQKVWVAIESRGYTNKIKIKKTQFIKIILK